jgi:hypothetical protein
MLKFLAIVAAFLLSTAAFAAPDGQTSPADGTSAVTDAKPVRPTTGLMRYDANGDGFVQRDEWNAGQHARFKQLDVNGDDKLTPDELSARPAGTTAATPATERRARRQAAYFDRLDADKDGFVSEAEFMVQAGRNFARCDHDRDGRIDTAECRQALRRKPTQPVNAER